MIIKLTSDDGDYWINSDQIVYIQADHASIAVDIKDEKGRVIKREWVKGPLQSRIYIGSARIIVKEAPEQILALLKPEVEAAKPWPEATP